MSTFGLVARVTRPAAAFSVLIVLATLCAGCATLIARYDEQIDRSATALQMKMDAFLTGLDTVPHATSQESAEFYDSYAVELRAMLIRAQSQPKNELTEKQLELMINNLNDLRLLHEAGPVTSETITTTRDLFNQGWKAVITLEVAKPRRE